MSDNLIGWNAGNGRYFMLRHLKRVELRLSVHTMSVNKIAMLDAAVKALKENARIFEVSI